MSVYEVAALHNTMQPSGTQNTAPNFTKNAPNTLNQSIFCEIFIFLKIYNRIGS